MGRQQGSWRAKQRIKWHILRGSSWANSSGAFHSLHFTRCSWNAECIYFSAHLLTSKRSTIHAWYTIFKCFKLCQFKTPFVSNKAKAASSGRAVLLTRCTFQLLLKYSCCILLLHISGRGWNFFSPQHFPKEHFVLNRLWQLNLKRQEDIQLTSRFFSPLLWARKWPACSRYTGEGALALYWEGRGRSFTGISWKISFEYPSLSPAKGSTKSSGELGQSFFRRWKIQVTVEDATLKRVHPSFFPHLTSPLLRQRSDWSWLKLDLTLPAFEQVAASIGAVLGSKDSTP